MLGLTTDICSHCGLWQFKPGDRYCGLCGQTLFTTQVVYLSRNNPPTPTTALLHISNDQDQTVTYELDCQKAWVQLQQKKIQINPHKTAEVQFRVDPSQFSGVMMDRAFVTVTKDGQLIKEICVEAYPAPEEINAQPLKVYKGVTKAELTFISKCPLLVDEVTFTVDPPIAELKYENQHLDLNLGNTAVPIAVSVHEVGSATVNFRLATAPARGGMEFTGSFPLEVKEPPTISIVGDPLQLDAFPDEETTFNLTIRNTGGDPLELRAMNLSPGSTDITWDHNFSPTQIEPNGSLDVKLTLKTKPTAQGDISTELKFQSNDPSGRTFQIYVRVYDAPYTGFIAVDYGTSASAVAYCQNAADNIELEPGGGGTKVKSDVYILGPRPGEDPPYEWWIGSKAKQLGDAEASPDQVPQFGGTGGRPSRYLKAAKVRIGTDNYYLVRIEGNTRTVPPEQVAQMAVMELLKLTRRGLRRQTGMGLPQSLIFSVPTRFTLHQQEVLKQVFTRAAAAKGIDLFSPLTVDESLAAGMYYFLCGAARDADICQRTEYTLLVMDFGGGTVDVTLFNVRNRLVEGRYSGIEKVEVMGSWGDPNLGGENLTQLMKTRFLPSGWPGDVERLKVNLSNAARVLLPSHRPAGQSVPLENDGVVRAALDELGLTREMTVSEYRTWLSQTQQNEEDILVRVPFAEDGLSVRKFLELCREWLQNFENEMDCFMKRANVDKADRLLLCGQASQLPVVPEVFGRFAQSTDYIKDQNGNPILKECVSLGALLYAIRQDDFKISGLDRLWRPLGILTSQVNQPVAFRELLRWGQDFGTESEQFQLPRGSWRFDQGHNRTQVKFTLKENLSLRQPRPVDFKTYYYEHDGQPSDRYIGKLTLTETGEVEAYCQINNKWQKMERRE